MNIKKKLSISIMILLFGGINFSLAQNINDIAPEVADFNTTNAMTDVETLKKSLDELIDELYDLDQQERNTNNEISMRFAGRKRH